MLGEAQKPHFNNCRIWMDNTRIWWFSKGTLFLDIDYVDSSDGSGTMDYDPYLTDSSQAYDDAGILSPIEQNPDVDVSYA